MMDINPSKSILDQVDEYLHDNNDILDSNNESTNNHISHTNTIDDQDVHLLEKDLDTEQSNKKSNNPSWISNNIQINLDQLSDSLFRGNCNNKLVDNKSTSNQNQNNNMFRDDNDRNNLMNGHHSLMTDINNFTNGYYESQNPTVSIPSQSNELHNMLNIPTDLIFSPSASPLIAPNQASMGGIQVTPFMQPLTLKHDLNYGNNHPFLGDPASVLDTTNTFNNNNNRKTSMIDNNNDNDTTAYNSHELILMDEGNDLLDNDPDMIPLTRSKTSTSNSNSNNNNNSSKKSHSISGQSSSRSESNSKIVKNSPYLKANRSRRRFSKSKNSLENTPILSSTNVTTTTTPATTAINNHNNHNNNNNNNNNNILNNNNNNNTNNLDDAIFQLPDSSVGSSGHTTPLSVSIGYNASSSTNNDEIHIKKNKHKNKDSESTKPETNHSPILPEKTTRSRSRAGRVKDDSKKEIHKVAEQERRNRLNNALTELGSLIPEELKQTVSIPSKATTAELACVYIRQLQQALDERKV